MNGQASVTRNEFLNSLAGPKATSFVPALVILSFLSFGTTLNETYQSQNQLAIITALAYQSLIFSIGYFLILGWLINKYFNKPNLVRVTSLIIIFFTTEMVRAIFVGEKLVSFGIAQEVNWGIRIIAGGFTGIALFGITSILLNDNFEYRENLRELEISKQSLAQAASVTENDIKNIRFQILDTIRSAINESLNSAVNKSNLSKENSKQVVEELVRISDEVVRPLSQDLFNSSFEVNEFMSLETHPKISSRRVFELATYIEPFRPIPVVTFGFLLLIGGALFIPSSPIEGLLALVSSLITFFIFFSIAKRYLQPKLIKLPMWLRMFVVTFVYFITIWFTLNWGVITSALEIETSVNTQSYFYVLAIIACWALAVYPAIKISRFETLELVKDANHKLSWLTTRLSAQLSTEKNQLASIIHRDVQGKLISSALKFQQEIAAGIEVSKASASLKNLVAEISNLIVDQNSAKAPQEVVDYLNYVWDGIFTIELIIDQNTKKRIFNDPVVKQSISDLIFEFTTNSVKHGKAKNGLVQISLSDSDVLHLEMSNDGLPLEPGRGQGLGTKMAFAQCISFEYRNLEPTGIAFEATLPIKIK